MADEGASPRELLMEASRRDNTDLLSELLTSLKTEENTAELINTARDGMGYTALHNAAKYGSYTLLDQPMVETDPLVPSTGATPLHIAVEYANSLPKDEWKNGVAIVDMLLEAGCDPRVKRKDGQRPIDIADSRVEGLVATLKKGEMAMDAGPDVVDEDADDGGEGSGSESD